MGGWLSVGVLVEGLKIFSLSEAWVLWTVVCVLREGGERVLILIGSYSTWLLFCSIISCTTLPIACVPTPPIIQRTTPDVDHCGATPC